VEERRDSYDPFILIRLKLWSNDFIQLYKMSIFKPTYPFPQIGYETLTGPPTLTSYCFEPDCPRMPFPKEDYDKSYTQTQESAYSLGLERYLQSRQIERDDFPYQTVPLYTSNMAPLSTNYMEYDYLGPPDAKLVIFN
jgi:hypothetical protein